MNEYLINSAEKMKYTAEIDAMWQRDGRKVIYPFTVTGKTVRDVNRGINYYLRFVLEPDIIPPEIFNAPNRNGYSGTDKGQGRHEIWFIPCIKVYRSNKVFGRYNYINGTFARQGDWIEDQTYIERIKNKQQIFWAYDPNNPNCMYEFGYEDTIGGKDD